jgi:hypothetical protein
MIASPQCGFGSRAEFAARAGAEIRQSLLPNADTRRFVTSLKSSSRSVDLVFSRAAACLRENSGEFEKNDAAVDSYKHQRRGAFCWLKARERANN